MNDLPFTIAPEAAAYIEQTLVWAYKENPELLMQAASLVFSSSSSDYSGPRVNLHAEFTASKHARNLAILTLGSAIDFVGDDESSPLFQTPHGPSVRKMAILLGHSLGKNFFRAFSKLELVGGGESAASGLAGEFAFFVLGMASLLSFFLSPHGKGFIDFGRRRGWRPAQFLFEFFDALFGRFQLSLQRHDDVDQAIDIDPTVTDILFELLDGVHASSLKKMARAAAPVSEKFGPEASYAILRECRR